jgi:hypothetical protein
MKVLLWFFFGPSWCADQFCLHFIDWTVRLSAYALNAQVSGFHTGWPDVVGTLHRNVFCNSHVEVTDYFISVFDMAVVVGNAAVQDVAVQRPYKN